MIVREKSDTLQLVTQAEHAFLSEKLALKNSYSEDLNEPLLKAIKHHDDGWAKWDQAPKLVDGRPRDYRNMDLTDHLEIMTRSIDHCQQLSEYAGWLVSKHGCSFHENKTVKPAVDFVTNEKTRRNQIQNDETLPNEAMRSHDFDWLQFTDALSLFMLDPWSSEWTWKRTPEHLQVNELSNDTFKISGCETYPDDLSFTFSYKSIPSKNYKSRPDLKQEISTGEQQTGEIILSSEP